MKYRAEIDGLRALAVVPVILFHAGLGLFGGGFVGVDIFFVISGYLITTILIEDIEKNRFSLLGFYERRARRILPALFFVMIVCIPFAWMWMLPTQMRDFSRSLVAVNFFSSNFLFWMESGYFDLAAEVKPLLHTWSLAVEEQFYVIFPIFLVLVWRLGRGSIFWIIAVLAIASLATSEWLWRSYPAANFYLAPSRAWELLAGSMSALVVSKWGVRENNFLSLLGLVAILIAIFVYDETTPFPSLYALLPVVGVVLLVLHAGTNTYAGKLLGARLFVGVGLISYSAYLWHQPLFAFARIRLVESPSILLMFALSCLAMLLALFSWRFVERPFRDKSKFCRKEIFSYSLIIGAVLTGLGLMGHFWNGFGQPRLVVERSQHHPSLDQDIWVIGDSHAAHLIAGLELETSKNVRNLASGGCIPFRDVDRSDFAHKKGNCASLVNANLDALIKDDPDAIVILSSMGPVYLDNTTFKGKGSGRLRGSTVELISDNTITDRWSIYEIGMRRTFMELSSLKNAVVIFAIDIPELGVELGCQFDGKVIRTPWFKMSDLVDTIYNEDKENCYVERPLYDSRVRRYKKLVENVSKDFSAIKIYDPTNTFCDDKKCAGYKPSVGYIYSDYDHLSQSGSEFYAAEFSKWFLNEEY